MILGVVQVSLGSQRLRDKALLPILDKPMTWWVYTRLRQAQLLDDVVLSFPEEDTPLIDLAEHFQMSYYAGSYRDLIDRIYSTAETFEADTVVRVTGDCPMVDPYIVDMVVAHYLVRQDETGCVVNSWPPTFPAGLDVSVYSTEMLRELWLEIKDPIYREWFTAYIKLHRDKFHVYNVQYPGEPLNRLRWTVDYPEDLEFVRCVYDQLGEDFDIFDVLALLRREPELIQINAAREIDPCYNFPYKEKLSE